MRFFFVALSFLLVNPSLADDLADLEALLQQAGATVHVADSNHAMAVIAAQAQRELLMRYRQADEAGRDAFSLRLEQALADPNAAMRIAAARTIAVRASAEDAGCLLRALGVEENARVQMVLIRCLARSISKLSPPSRESAATAAADLFDEMLRDDATQPEIRNMLATSLGRLGEAGLPAVRRLVHDLRWGRILHSSLPAALAATGNATVVFDILELYEADSSTGFRIACIHALAALLGRTDDAYQPAVDFLQAVVREPVEPMLSAAAALAYAHCPSARNDAEIVATVRSRLLVSVGDELKYYLRALMKLDVPLDEEIEAFLATIATCDQVAAAQRKIAAAILERVATR